MHKSLFGRIKCGKTADRIFGARSKSIDVARILIEAQGGDMAGTLNFEAYSGKTDELGRIHIRNLPSRSAQEFSVSQKGFTNLTKSIDPPSPSNAGDEKELTERPTSRISVTLKKSDGAH